MTQVKKLDFSGTSIYCEVDVHKKSRRVNIADSEFELEDFTHYPGANYKIGYEAGFSMQRSLSAAGCDCLLVNAADIPTSDKEKKQKQDKADTRKLCNYLQFKKWKSAPIVIGAHDDKSSYQCFGKKKQTCN